MDNLLGGALGSAMGKDGLAEMAGKKVGDLVEGAVKNVMGGGENKKEDEKAGGFNVGDVLSLVGGKKEGGGGLDVSKAIGGPFN